MFSVKKVAKTIIPRQLGKLKWKNNFITEKTMIDKIFDPVTGETYPPRKPKLNQNINKKT